MQSMGRLLPALTTLAGLLACLLLGTASPVAAADISDYAPPDTPADSAAVLEGILSQPEYQENTEQQLARRPWLLRFIDRLQQLLTPLAASTGLQVMVLAISVLVLAFAAIVLLRKYNRRPPAGRLDMAHGSAPAGTYDGLREQADAAASRGEYRLALRYRFLACLKSLKLPTVTVISNWRLLARINRSDPGLTPWLRELVRIYEDGWYGGSTITAADYGQAAELAGSIEAALESRGEEVAVRA
jgi:hypothetical protein